MKFKVGDLVVLLANRYNSGDPLSKEYIGNNKHLKGMTLKIQDYGYDGWEYRLEAPNKKGIMVKSDQIVLARIAKTEIYKALTQGE